MMCLAGLLFLAQRSESDASIASGRLTMFCIFGPCCRDLAANVLVAPEQRCVTTSEVQDLVVATYVPMPVNMLQETATYSIIGLSLAFNWLANV